MGQTFDSMRDRVVAQVKYQDKCADPQTYAEHGDRLE